MVKVLQNNWKLIVITLLCIHVYVDADPPNNIVWKVLRRLLDDGGFPFSSIVKDTNISNVIDDGVRRARMKYTTIESYSSHHPSQKNHTKQKPKHHFIVEFENEANVSKHLSHKDYENRPPKLYYEGRIHPRVEPNDTVEPDKKLKTLSKSKSRDKSQDETLLPMMENRTKQNTDENKFPKLAVRAGKHHDESDEISLRNNRNEEAVFRITKMPHAYQLQDDADDVPTNTKQPKNNDRLNPYAIDQQMQRYIDCYRKDMNITMEVIGRTAEYNNIVLLKVTEIPKDETNFRSIFEHKYADEAPEKKIIFIVHGLAVMGMGDLIHDENIFRTLMSYYTAYLSQFDLFIIPIANPDGFTAILNSQYEKFWNKNKSPQSSCSGVSLDRNFDVEWNTTHGISPCSHTYPGPAPFSEPETRAVRDILHLYSQKIVAYIHVHASTFHKSIFKGDAVLYPRGYTSLQNDDDKYLDIKGDIEESMKNASFRIISVTVEPIYYWYGKVVGTSVDYASSVYGIPYAMEFSMQAYDEHWAQDALLQIWRRIIDVVFKNIAKYNNNNDRKKK